MALASYLVDEQSGQIESIGFSLYMDMLEQAVTALREGPRTGSRPTHSCPNRDCDLRIPRSLTGSLHQDVNVRLSLYKRIAGARDRGELDDTPLSSGID